MTGCVAVNNRGDNGDNDIGADDAASASAINRVRGGASGQNLAPHGPEGRMGTVPTSKENSR